MKYLKQLFLILGISFIGEVLNACIPLPIPAGVYGMVILFTGLITGIIKPEWVKDTGKFLLEIMPVMFVPAGVGLMANWSTLQPILLPVAVIIVVTNITVMFSTGRLSQAIMKKGRGKDRE